MSDSVNFMGSLNFGDWKELTLQVINPSTLTIVTTICSNSQHAEAFDFCKSDSPHLTDSSDSTAYCVNP